jgi:hypothetical protein
MKIAYIKLFLFSVFLLLAVNNFTVPAQTQKETNARVELTMPQDNGIFGKVSSTENDADEEFRIVSVRRMYVLYNSFDSGSKKRKDYIEIELYLKVLPSATNLPDIIQIGDKTFPITEGCGNKRNCLQVTLSPEEFESLRDNSILTLYKGLRGNPNMLKEMYKNGEPKTVNGAKFGRLNKKAADKLPPLEKPEIQ